ncbi:hypothetical protein NQZ68_013088 [Dissostichus eleginoides]|nr:hypothetical protein NQZ68_013088 [Dissostichus eleginoides]
MASWKTQHRAQPVQSWTFREVFSGLVGNESTCILKAFVAPSVVSTPPSVGKRTAGSAEKEAERAQTKVGLCAPSTVDLWKIPRQRCAKMPGPARRDSGGMQLSSGGSPGLPGPKRLRWGYRDSFNQAQEPPGPLHLVLLRAAPSLSPIT